MIRLFTAYYTDPVKKRCKELKRCLRNNLDNPLIDEVHVIVESEAARDSLSAARLFVHHYSVRPTFDIFFELANMNSPSPDDITIICNSDIYFNDTLELVHKIQPHEAFALSRWDITGGDKHRPSVRHFNTWDSQDAWIFRGRIRPVNAPFKQGIAGCDNRLAAELERAGYTVRNPSISIMAIHLHLSGDSTRKWQGREEVVPPPYKLLTPEEI